VRGKHNKLGEGERKVRLGQDSLPNIAISVAETIYVVLPGLVTNHKIQHKENFQHFLVHSGSGETGVLKTLNHRVSA